MNTKKIIAGICTCLILMAAACTPNTTAEDEQLFEQGVDKSKVTTGNQQSVDKSKVTIDNQQSVDKSKVRSSN